MDTSNIFIWLAKVMLYLASAAAIGGYFIRLLSPAYHLNSLWLRRYGLSAALLGLGSVVLAFTLQLLLFSGQGWASFYDWELYSLLLNSKQGVSWSLAAAGFTLYAVSTALLRPALLHSIAVVACLSILLSFSFSGHLVNSPWYGKVGLLLHVLAMSLWMGSLLPLWRISRSSETELVASVMQRFGNVAVVFVGLLVLAGALMLLLLLSDLRELWQTDYGQTLLVKFSLVLVLLGLAAINKFLLVPHISKPGVGKRLNATISLEIAAGIMLLAVTAFATVVIGLDKV